MHAPPTEHCSLFGLEGANRRLALQLLLLLQSLLMVSLAWASVWGFLFQGFSESSAGSRESELWSTWNRTNVVSQVAEANKQVPRHHTCIHSVNRPTMQHCVTLFVPAHQCQTRVQTLGRLSVTFGFSSLSRVSPFSYDAIKSSWFCWERFFLPQNRQKWHKRQNYFADIFSQQLSYVCSLTDVRKVQQCSRTRQLDRSDTSSAV